MSEPARSADGRIVGVLNDDHTITFDCECGAPMTIPAWGDEPMTHACGLVWRWAGASQLYVEATA